MGLRYSFEKMYDGTYRVRLKGEFVMSSPVKSSEYVDNELKKLGYNSREEVLKVLIADSIASLGLKEED